MTDTEKDPLERAIELLVFAPIGLGLLARDAAPSYVNLFVERGRAEVDMRVTTARSLGQVAIAFGVPMVREKVQARVGDVRRRAEDLLGLGANVAPAPAPAPVAEPEPEREEVPAPVVASTPSVVTPITDAPSTPRVPAPESDTLPIPGYDALSASQVVERLTGLARDELDAVHAYEAAHRQRRTILGKIEQLAG